MKLLQINVTANRGSTGRIAEEIGRVAMAQGWESWIAYGRGKPQSTSRLIRIGNDFDMKLHAVETRLFDNHGLASRRVTRHFLRQVEEIKPDVIHLHNIHGYFINYKLLFDWLKRWGGSVVWTLHDCWTLTGHCSHYDFIGCDRWQTGCHDCPQRNRYPASRLCDRSRRNWLNKREAFTGLKNMTIVPVSDWLRAQVEKSYLGGYPIQRIYNGIDLTTFHPTQPKFKILGVASVWEERKGLADFVKLRELLPADEYAITIVGLTAKQIETLPQGITGIRRTNSITELARLYSESNALVNPTLEDSYPTVNLEAMACGLPVITYRTGGSPESVTPETGLVVPKGDISALADAVRAVCSGSIPISRAACRARAEDIADKAKAYRQYIRLYNSI